MTSITQCFFRSTFFALTGSKLKFASLADILTSFSRGEGEIIQAPMSFFKLHPSSFLPTANNLNLNLKTTIFNSVNVTCNRFLFIVPQKGRSMSPSLLKNMLSKEKKIIPEFSRPPLPPKCHVLNSFAGFKSSSTCQLSWNGLSVDAGGTLLEPSHPVFVTYANIGKKYGVVKSPEEIKQGFKRAFTSPWPEKLKYEGDGKKFWRFVVASATENNDSSFFEELYQHYTKPDAWRIADGAVSALSKIKNAGVKLCIISNFDSRLKPLLQEMNIYDLFDAIIVSSEVGFEKPSPDIFKIALEKMDLADPSRVLHVGDDEVADFQGATSAGFSSWLWKRDVISFHEIQERILSPS